MPAMIWAIDAVLRDWVSSRRGATAVEFALIAIPFLMLLIGIAELGLMFTASAAMEAATTTEARLVRTGQFQKGADTSSAAFKNGLCDNISWISTADCQAKLAVDVRTFSSFSAISVTPPVSGGAIDPSQLTFQPGSSCEIVLVRSFYPWTLLAPVIEPGLPNLGPGQRLLTTTEVFRNENWQANGTACA